MTKAFADYTLKQRADMVGMLCSYPSRSGRPDAGIGIIYSVNVDGDVIIRDLDTHTLLGHFAKDIVLRPDLHSCSEIRWNTNERKL